MVALDPADGTAEGDEQALCAAGVGVDGEICVLASEGTRQTPLEWLKRAIRLAPVLDAVIVVEKNHGGAFLTGLLEQAMGEAGVRTPYKMIDAHQGKRTRAEPAAVLYETGKVHHVGRHDVLEEQLVSFTGAPGEKSPDRLDAAVHGLRELMGYTGSRDSGAAVAQWSTDPPREGDPVASWGSWESGGTPGTWWAS